MEASDSYIKGSDPIFRPYKRRRRVEGLKRPKPVVHVAPISSDAGVPAQSAMVSVLNKNISDMEAQEMARSASAAADKAAEKARAAKAVFEEKAAIAVKARAAAEKALKAVEASKVVVPCLNSMPDD